MEYNDEILCPELYEKMAKEYQKNLNTKTPKNYSENLFSFFDNLNNNINFLNNIKNLSNGNKNYLLQINKTFKKINLNYNFNNKKINTNYCECLTNSINTCTNCIKEICSQNIISKDISTILNSLLSIIENLSNMYGICKYRKI